VELQAARSRVKSVQKSVFDAKKELQVISLNRPIETALDLLRESLGEIIMQLRKKQTDLLAEQRQLTVQTQKVTQAIAEIMRAVDEKQAELNDFQGSSADRFTEYTEEVQRKWMAEFDLEKQRLIELDEGIAPKRVQYTHELEQYEGEILRLRRENEDILYQIMNERAADLAQLEQELLEDHHRALAEIEEEHQKLTRSLEKDREVAKAEHEAKMVDIRRNSEEQAALVEMAHIQQMTVLGKEKAEIERQMAIMREKLDRTAAPFCPECIERKEVIRRLTARRDELRVRLKEFGRDSVTSDHKLNALFPKRLAAARSQLSVGTATDPNPKMPRAVTRPLSSIRKAPH
jgi:hypothetical protein